MNEWVTPTGGGGEWNDEANARDNNLTTLAQYYKGYGWTESFYHTHASLSCSKVRAYLDDATWRYTIAKIEVYYNSAWHQVFYANFARKAWTEVDLGGYYDVTQIRFQFYNPSASAWAKVYETAFYWAEAPIKELAASITPSSNVSGSLTIPVRFNGFIAANSNISASLSTLLIALNGSIITSSNISGNLNVITQLEGSIVATSGISGSLITPIKLQSSFVATSNISGNLNVITQLIGSIVATAGINGSLIIPIKLQSSFVATSNISGNLNVITQLIGSIVATAGINGSLIIPIKLQSSFVATSNVSGSLNSQPGCDGLVSGASGVSGNLNINKEFYGLTTGALETGGVLTTVYLNVERCLIGFVISTSDLSGWLIPYFDGRNIIKPISLLLGSLNIIRQLEGISSIVSVSQGNINLLSILLGLLNEGSNISGIAHFVALGFYENLANQLSAYFQDIADVNNLIVRYDNDLRATPSDNLWCEYNIDFGNATQNNLGIDTFRNIGNFNIRIKNQIGLGIGELFEKADIISTAFLRKNLNRIIFDIPKIRKIGRVEDNYQVNVICPFFSDKIGK